MKWYMMKQEEVVYRTNANVKQGLNDKNVRKRIGTYGQNKLKEAPRPSVFVTFLAQFKDFMVLVLLAATLISGLIGEMLDALTIMCIVLLNGILGFFQERKAEKSLDALKELSAPQMYVKRNGEWQRIASVLVVPGDIVKMSAGDRVGADIRLLETSGLRIDEASLTGESHPSQKQSDEIAQEDVPLGDRANMAFMGTMVTQGSGVGVVVGTGMRTEMGKIAHLLQEAEVLATPLQRRLEQLGRTLIVVALLLTTLVVLFGLLQGHDLHTMFISGVSLAVAAIPEGLPAIVTVALALGVQRMIKRKGIVRKLPAVETLGCASVICSDKTGTLTQNKMTVKQLWTKDQWFSVTGAGYDLDGEILNQDDQRIDLQQEVGLQRLLSYGALCTNAHFVKKEENHTLDGDPTEGALLIVAAKSGYDQESLARTYQRVEEFPFDSTRKMMSVIVSDPKGKKYVVTKGAPDVVLHHCRSIFSMSRSEALSDHHCNQINKAVEKMASNALRTLAIAYRPLIEGELCQSAEQAEKHLTFVGLQGMMDPPRVEAKEAVEECRAAGIKTLMITGDHQVTAAAIAKELAILPEGGRVLNGGDLDRLSVNELEREVESVYVYARVSPAHKLKIVQALQKRGHIVAMTGDGVNDAPALKAANIGVAMGVTGTDVAKESSALVLADDNFLTIKEAIKEGRNIYENIRKFIRYMLASNVGEILVMLFAMMLGMPLPLVAIQILWINLVTDGLPAVALGMDQAEGDVMRRKPRAPDEGVFARGLGWKIVSRGFMIGMVTLIAFTLTYDHQPDNLILAQTVAFLTLVMSQLIHVFDCRSEYSVYHRNPFENRYLVGAVALSVVLMVAVIYMPTLQPIFHTVSLGVKEWLLVLGMASIPTVVFGGFGKK
ncbi:calcium-translocating P-type ATPase, SERCA-type [Bacillus sp. FSL W7-1360]